MPDYDSRWEEAAWASQVDSMMVMNDAGGFELAEGEDQYNHGMCLCCGFTPLPWRYGPADDLCNICLNDEVRRRIAQNPNSMWYAHWCSLDFEEVDA